MNERDSAAAHERRWLVLGAMCLSLLLIVLDNTIVNVALPTLQRDLDATTSQLQWIVDSYVLVFAGLLLTMGAVGDRFGRRGALTAGLAIMGAASVLAVFADSANQLIAIRALMGVGGALVMPSTLSILTNVFTEPTERARAIGIWAAFAGAGGAIGPVAGGFLLEHFWWGSVFLLNVPVVVVAIVANRLIVPTSRDANAPRLDIPGALLSIVGLVSLVYGIIEGQHGWTEPNVLVGFAIAVVILTAFVLWERHTPQPMLDVQFFRNRRFSVASTAVCMTFFAMFGSMFLMTQYLQFVLGYTALETGVRLLPMAGVMMVFAPTSARIVERVGTKIVVSTGLAIAGLGLVVISLLTPESSYLNVLGALFVGSFGMSLVMAPATESIMGSLPPAKAGVGSAVNDTTRELGAALGIAVLGSVFASSYGPRMNDATAALGLPDGVRDSAADQIGSALAIANDLGAPGAQLAAAARDAFVDGMGTSLIAGAVVMGLASLLTLLLLPARGRPVGVTGDSAGESSHALPMDGAGRDRHSLSGASENGANDGSGAGRPESTPDDSDAYVS
ncbi:MAG TPA: MFS transporter [Acidimicrobiales bacterium]